MCKSKWQKPPLLHNNFSIYNALTMPVFSFIFQAHKIQIQRTPCMYAFAYVKRIIHVMCTLIETFDKAFKYILRENAHDKLSLRLLYMSPPLNVVIVYLYTCKWHRQQNSKILNYCVYNT